MFNLIPVNIRCHIKATYAETVWTVGFPRSIDLITSFSFYWFLAQGMRELDNTAAYQRSYVQLFLASADYKPNIYLAWL